MRVPCFCPRIRQRFAEVSGVPGPIDFAHQFVLEDPWATGPAPGLSKQDVARIFKVQRNRSWNQPIQGRGVESDIRTLPKSSNPSGGARTP